MGGRGIFRETPSPAPPLSSLPRLTLTHPHPHPLSPPGRPEALTITLENWVNNGDLRSAREGLGLLHQCLPNGLCPTYDDHWPWSQVHREDIPIFLLELPSTPTARAAISQHAPLSPSPFLNQENTCVCVLVTQLCLTLCNPIDYSLPDFTFHGSLQARILEWVSMPFSRGSSQTRDRTWVSWIASKLFTIQASREALKHLHIDW